MRHIYKVQLWREDNPDASADALAAYERSLVAEWAVFTPEQKTAAAEDVYFVSCAFPATTRPLDFPTPSFGPI
jgi:hypothetical protein